MRRAAAIWAALAIGATSARADCDHFKWPLTREKAWFAAAPEPIDAGAEIAAGSGAYEVALKPEPAAGFVLPPRKLTSGAFGAVVNVPAIPQPGLYQVTLSREAWVDLIQSGARARARGVSRQRDCPAFAKSVRFRLAAGPAVMQVNGVTAASIALALARAP